MNLSPLGDQILVKPTKQESEYGSLITSDHTMKKPQKGVVVAVGEGRLDEPMRMRVGDKVFFQQHGTVSIEDGDEQYLLMPQYHCLAKWKK